MSQVIVDQVRAQVRAGRLRPGDRLPSERAMCDAFGVSRVTVREALRVLEAAGLVQIRLGARGGAVIVAPSRERLSRSLADLIALNGFSATDVAEARAVLHRGIALADRPGNAVVEMLVDSLRVPSLSGEGQASVRGAPGSPVP